MEIIIILLLILLNGVFAMAELAIVSARKSKLQQQANEGNKKAQTALDLANNPTRFLSTVQIGISLVGIFAGAFGGATIAEALSSSLSQIPLLSPYSDALGLAIVVIVIAYLSLIIGELVPKKIALSNPEKIATLVAGPMNTVSMIGAPFVSVLSFSTEWVFRLLGIKLSEKSLVSDEEIYMLIREGARMGIFERGEKDIVERTLRLGDKKINTLMTPRKEIIWIDIDSSFKEIRSKITKNQYSHFPICRNNLDNVLGIVRAKEVFTNFLLEEKIDLKKYLHKPLFIPESMVALKVLELFKKSGIHIALVVDEYGNVQGLLSLTDILEAIVGDIPTVNELEEMNIVKRDDGTYLVDGLVSIDEFKDYFHIKKLPAEKTGIFHTIGGLVMHKIERVPVPGDNFELGTFKFEVIDMDGNRVDKLLINPLKRLPA